MGFFSGLISLFNYLLVLMFVLIVGVVAGVILFKCMLEKCCPKAYEVMTTEFFSREEKRASEAAQMEEDKDGIIWTE